MTGGSLGAAMSLVASWEGGHMAPLGGHIAPGGHMASWGATFGVHAIEEKGEGNA